MKFFEPGFYLSPDGHHIIEILDTSKTISGQLCQIIVHENSMEDRASYVSCRNSEIFFSAWERLSDD